MALDANLIPQVQGVLAKMVNPIVITTYTDDSDNSSAMMELLREVQGLSNNKIELVPGNQGAARTPSFTIGERVSFAGLPLGHEFTSFVLAVLLASGHPPKVDADKIEQIKSITGTFKFETYISLSCHNCPEVVQALNTLSLINPNISHTMIDGAVFQQEVNDKKILAVPTIFLNGEHFGQGRMELEEILAMIDTGASDRAAEKLNAEAPYDVLIVGGGPAGASAAVYAARKGIRTGIVAERFGGQVMDTVGIENFISVKATEGPKLVKALEEHVKEYDVDIHNLQRAKSITKKDLIEVELEGGATLKSKTVIISTGARWRELGVTGEKEFKGKGVAYCPHCDGPLFKGKRVAVIGGGNSGIEAAIDLAGIVGHVTVFEFMPELKADAVLQKRLYSLPNVTVNKNVQVREITGTDKVDGITYTDRDNGEEHHLELEGVFVQIGLVPNTDFVKDTIQLSRFGEIEIGKHNETNVPGVFAAGDCTAIPYKQIIIAMGEGSNAALGAFDYLIRN